MASLTVDPSEMRPLIEEVAAEVIRRAEALRRDRMAYTEAEAAALIGLTETQLADERRRGRIVACRIVGDRIRYSPEQIDRYLRDREDLRYANRKHAPAC